MSTVLNIMTHEYGCRACSAMVEHDDESKCTVLLRCIEDHFDAIALSRFGKYTVINFLKFHPQSALAFHFRARVILSIASKTSIPWSIAYAMLDYGTREDIIALKEAAVSSSRYTSAKKSIETKFLSRLQSLIQKDDDQNKDDDSQIIDNEVKNNIDISQSSNYVQNTPINAASSSSNVQIIQTNVQQQPQVFFQYFQVWTPDFGPVMLIVPIMSLS